MLALANMTHHPPPNGVICHAEAQDAYSDGSSPHKSIVSDDAAEVFGESIDEDSQSVKQPNNTAPPPSTSGAWAHLP